MTLTPKFLKSFGSRRLIFVQSGLVLLFALLINAKGRLQFTGDEPRYQYYGYSFFERQFLTLPEVKWGDFLERHHFGRVSPGHSIKESFAASDLKAIGGIIPSIVASPWIGWFGPSGGRTFNFIFGFIGVVYLFLALNRLYPKGIATAAGIASLLTIPFLSHLLVFNLDIFLFTLASAVFYFLAEPDRKKLSLIFLPALICCLPLMHTRASLIAGLLMAIYAYRLNEARKTRSGMSLTKPLMTAALGFAFFAFIQMYMYGSFENLRSITFVIERSTVFPRILLEWFQFRHGILVNAPIYLLSLLGLVASFRRKNVLAILGTLIFCIYTVTIITQDASESFPSRLWVFLIPVFALGTAQFLSLLQNRRQKILGAVIATPVVVYHLALLKMFVVQPNAALWNRMYGRFYDDIYNGWPHLHLGFFLPAKFSNDAYNFDIENTTRSLVWLALVTTVGIGFLSGIRSRSRLGYVVGLTLILAGLGAAADLSHIETLPKAGYSCRAAISATGLKQAQLTFKEPQHVLGLRLQEQTFERIAGSYKNPDYPIEVLVQPESGPGIVTRFLPIIYSHTHQSTKSLTLAEASAAKLNWTDTCYDILLDGSIIRRVLSSN